MGLFFVLLYLAASLLSPGDLFPGAEAYRPLVVVLAMATVVSVFPLLGVPVLSSVRKSATMMIFFIGMVMFSRIPQRWLGGTILALGAILPNVAMYFFGLLHFRSPKRLSVVRLVLVLVSAYIIAMGISEIATVRATGQQTPYILGGLTGAGALTIRLRGLGLLNDPNHLGQLLAIILPMLMVTNRVRVNKKARPGILAYLAGAVLLVGIYLTNSRGTQLSVLLFGALLLTSRYRALGMFLSAICMPLSILLLNATRGREIAVTSGVDRLAIWSDGLSYFKHSPVWGIGYNAFQERQGMTAHNSFLLCATELGLLGMFFWMALIVVIVLQLRKVSALSAAGGDPLLGQWARAIRWSLYVFLLTAFFLSRTYTMPLFLLLGMGAAIIHMAGGENKLPITPRWPLWTFGFCIGSIAVTYLLVRLRAV